MRATFPYLNKARAKVGCYASQFYWDSVNRQFYQKTIPDYAVPEAEFNKKFYFFNVDPEDRPSYDCAAVIKAIKNAEVHGRVYEPDNPENIVVRDGLKYVNVRQSYYDALNERRAA